MDKIFFDYHSKTPPCAASLKAWSSSLQRHWMAPGSLHPQSKEAVELFSQSSSQILSLLGACSDDHFYPFSSVIDATKHLFLYYYLEHIRETGKNHILVLESAEAPVFLACKKLEAMGCHVKKLAFEKLIDALNPRVGLVSLHLADRLTGAIHQIEPLIKLCKEKGIAVHLDVSAAVGKFPICFEAWGVDFLTLDGSLCFAPRGISALFVRKDLKLSAPHPLAIEAHLAGSLALSEALSYAIDRMQEMQLDVAELRHELEQAILARVPGAQLVLERKEHLPNVVVLAFEGVHSEALAYLLARKQVYASIGGGMSQRLSSALGPSALSFALSFENSQKEIEPLVTILEEAVSKLRRLSS